MKKLFVRLLIISIFASILMALMFIVTNNGGNVFGKLLVIMVIVSVFSIVGMVCASSFDNRKNLLVSVLGMFMAMFAMVYFGLHTWNSFQYDIKIAGLIITSNLFFIWLGIVLDDRVEQIKQRWIRISTAVVITLMAGLVMFIIWNIDSHIDSIYYKLLLGLGTLSIILSIVVLLMEARKGTDFEHVLLPEIKAVKEEDLPQVTMRETVTFVEDPNARGQFMQVKTQTVVNEPKK